MSERDPLASPLDAGRWPTQLEAKVVSSGFEPRVHGYSVDRDLVRHYGLGACVGLALTGDLLGDVHQRALDAAMIVVAPVGVHEAGCHVGLLARVAGTTAASTIAATALGLAQTAGQELAQHATWLDWLDRGCVGVPPTAFLACDSADRAAADSLNETLAAFAFEVPVLRHGPKRVASALAVMHECGLSREAMTTAMVVARLPVAMAEALARPILGMRDYPMNVPVFEYEECK